MNRRTLIIALLGSLFALQVAMLVGWHVSSGNSPTTIDVATSFLALAATAIIYTISARLYFAAIRRSTEAHAARGNEELERTFELYRAMAQREEQLTRKVCQAIEAELGQAREDLADGKIEQTDSHLQHCLDMATDALPQRCRNVTVAAALEAESRQCANESIEFVTKADVPATIALPDIDVAAVLFSMIDKALADCKALRAEDPSANPTITVRALTEKDQLVIEVENSRYTGKSQKRKKSAKGVSQDGYDWNSKVVDNLVKSHGGIVETVEENDLTRTTVMIPMEHMEASAA